MATFVKIDWKGGVFLVLLALLIIAALAPETFDAMVIQPGEAIWNGIQSAGGA